ncbi:MAG: type II toxin-antitoxin system VapC family toxin [Actinobacteria bacterium]|jgi:predicted nucleic acid-binding protein|nr:type II toxin-antitoxin system VapC family toxin [Actinomycetota bacterium]
MLVPDASCLIEALIDGPLRVGVLQRLSSDPEQIAPHIVDVEVLGVLIGFSRRGLIDETTARRAMLDLREWPCQRVPHGPFLERAWELRHNVRGWDAVYVALAEVLDATLLTKDARLARASGPRCSIELIR